MRLLYDGEEVELTPAQEEVAVFYAGAVQRNLMQLQQEKTAKIFKANFFEDWRRLLGAKHRVRSLAKCDFSRIVAAA